MTTARVIDNTVLSKDITYVSSSDKFSSNDVNLTNVFEDLIIKYGMCLKQFLGEAAKESQIDSSILKEVYSIIESLDSSYLFNYRYQRINFMIDSLSSDINKAKSSIEKEGLVNKLLEYKRKKEVFLSLNKSKLDSISVNDLATNFLEDIKKIQGLLMQANLGLESRKIIENLHEFIDGKVRPLIGKAKSFSGELKDGIQEFSRKDSLSGRTGEGIYQVDNAGNIKGYVGRFGPMFDTQKKEAESLDSASLVSESLPQEKNEEVLDPIIIGASAVDFNKNEHGYISGISERKELYGNSFKADVLQSLGDVIKKNNYELTKSTRAIIEELSRKNVTRKNNHVLSFSNPSEKNIENERIDNSAANISDEYGFDSIMSDFNKETSEMMSGYSKENNPAANLSKPSGVQENIQNQKIENEYDLESILKEFSSKKSDVSQVSTGRHL